MKWLLTFIVSLGVLAQTPTKELLKKVDDLYRSKGSKGEIEMEVTTPDWSRTMKMKMWTRGLDYTFIVIKKPRKDKGVSSLKRKSEVWNFFPKINKVIKVPPSMMMGSWMGSDFTNDDLVKESTLVGDYKVLETKKNNDEIVIALAPKKDTVSLWGKIDLVIDKKSELPVRQEFYDERGEKIRVMYFRDVKTFDSRTIPTTMELVPLNRKGHKTTVRYKSIQFDVDVPVSTFSLTNLQRRR